MVSPYPGPLVAQAVVVILAMIVFTGILTVVGSERTYDIPEHAIHVANATVTPEPGEGITATATSAPVFTDDLSETISPEAEIDDMLSQPDLELLQLPATLSGNGSQITDSFWLEPGIIAFDIIHDDSDDFNVWLMYDDSERFELLMAKDGGNEGQVIVEILTAGAYYLDVSASGEWLIDVSHQDGAGQ